MSIVQKLIKFLKVPVSTSKIQGAGLGNAKWSKFKHKGKVVVENKLLFTTDDAINLKPDEIMQRLTTELTYNEFDFQKDQNVLVKGNTKAEGFETMFYTCPCCNKEFTLKSSGNTIECTNCGTTATILDDFTFKWNTEKQYFENYSQWYDWQYQNMLDLVQQPDFKLEEEMDYGIDIPGVNNYQKVGHGVLSFTQQGWDYKGTFNGQQFEDHDDIKAVFLATLKVGKHIELPHKDGHCRVFYPKNGLTSMKWHLASRAMSELKNQ